MRQDSKPQSLGCTTVPDESQLAATGAPPGYWFTGLEDPMLGVGHCPPIALALGSQTYIYSFQYSSVSAYCVLALCTAAHTGQDSLGPVLVSLAESRHDAAKCMVN